MNLQHQYAAENTQYPTTPIIGFNGQYTGNGLADWLLGYMQSYEQGAGEIAVGRGWQPGFYGQDQFRIRPNLTITAGLRWDPILLAPLRAVAALHSYLDNRARFSQTRRSAWY